MGDEIRNIADIMEMGDDQVEGLLGTAGLFDPQFRAQNLSVADACQIASTLLLRRAQQRHSNAMDQHSRLLTRLQWTETFLGVAVLVVAVVNIFF